MKNVFENWPNDADFDDNGYVTAEEQTSDLFYDVDQDRSDSDSNHSGFESNDENYYIIFFRWLRRRNYMTSTILIDMSSGIQLQKH